MQPDLPFETSDADRETLRAHLHSHGWQTRRDLTLALNWSERKVRDTAESLGAEIVRGQAGFKLTEQLDRSDAGLAIQARDAAISHGKKMIRYGLALGRRIHALVK